MATLRPSVKLLTLSLTVLAFAWLKGGPEFSLKTTGPPGLVAFDMEITEHLRLQGKCDGFGPSPGRQTKGANMTDKKGVLR